MQLKWSWSRYIQVEQKNYILEKSANNKGGGGFFSYNYVHYVDIRTVTEFDI
mgnify:CR=1 FL=1